MAIALEVLSFVLVSLLCPPKDSATPKAKPRRPGLGWGTIEFHVECLESKESSLFEDLWNHCTIFSVRLAVPPLLAESFGCFVCKSEFAVVSRRAAQVFHKTGQDFQLVDVPDLKLEQTTTVLHVLQAAERADHAGQNEQGIAFVKQRQQRCQQSSSLSSEVLRS